MNIVIPYNHSSFSHMADFIWQTALELAHTHRVHLVLRLHEHVGFKLKSADQTVFSQIPYPMTSVQQANLFFWTVPQIIPPQLRQVSGKLDQLNRSYVRDRVVEFILHLDNSVLWSFDQENYDLFIIKWPSSVFTLFDCVDFYTTTQLELAEVIESHVRTQISKADLTVVNSQTLYRHWQTVAKRIELVPQGFDIDSFIAQDSQSDTLEIIEMLKKIDRPKIGYIGALNYRLDFELLTDLITHQPEWQFVMPEFRSFEPEDDLSQLEAFLDLLRKSPHVSLYPRLRRPQIKSVIELLDVGLIPYDISYRFNQKCYPMKLFEYFYCGIPVVSTPIEELRRFPQYVRIAPSSNQAISEIETLLVQPWSKTQQQCQRQLASDNSWGKKVAQITKLIELYETS